MAKIPNKRDQGKSSCNSQISPDSLPLFTEAPSEERKTILLHTDSRECLWNIAKIVFFKSGTSWISAGATTLKNFMVCLNVSGSVKITYNTPYSMMLLLVDLSHKIAIKFIKCIFSLHSRQINIQKFQKWNFYKHFHFHRRQ